MCEKNVKEQRRYCEKRTFETGKYRELGEKEYMMAKGARYKHGTLQMMKLK